MQLPRSPHISWVSTASTVVICGFMTVYSSATPPSISEVIIPDSAKQFCWQPAFDSDSLHDSVVDNYTNGYVPK